MLFIKWNKIAYPSVLQPTQCCWYQWANPPWWLDLNVARCYVIQQVIQKPGRSWWLQWWYGLWCSRSTSAISNCVSRAACQHPGVHCRLIREHVFRSRRIWLGKHWTCSGGFVSIHSLAVIIEIWNSALLSVRSAVPASRPRVGLYPSRLSLRSIISMGLYHTVRTDRCTTISSQLILSCE
jgi:hypothetical protein